MTENPNERTFDQMVDGELNNEERSRLLCACEDDPDRWRSLALAYVEAQTWRSDLLSIRDESQQPETTVIPGSHHQHRRLPVRRLLNVAAMLLLSLTVGYGIGAFSFTSSSDDSSPPLASQQTSPANTTPENDNQIFVLVQNQQTDELQPMKVPLVNISDINTGLSGHHQIPRDVWQSLQKAGHDVSHRRQWYPVRLKDGRKRVGPD